MTTRPNDRRKTRAWATRVLSQSVEIESRAAMSSNRDVGWPKLLATAIRDEPNITLGIDTKRKYKAAVPIANSPSTVSRMMFFALLLIGPLISSKQLPESFEVVAGIAQILAPASVEPFDKDTISVRSAFGLTRPFRREGYSL